MIATVTFNPAVDYTVSIPGDLADGDVARAEDHRYDPGGKGVNVTKFLDAMGVASVASAPVGGFLGDYFRDRLRADGVPTALVEIAGLTRLNATVHADRAEYKVNQSGPVLDAADVDDLVATLAEHEPETVVVAGSLPPGIDAGAIDHVATAGEWDAIVDVGGDVLAELDAEYALCKPNRSELAAATGREVRTVDDAVQAAEELCEQGFERVLASLGAEGALLVRDGEPIVRPARETDVVDTVGAGDALLAGYLAGVARGLDPAGAVDRGVEVATAVVGVRGPSVPASIRE